MFVSRRVQSVLAFAVLTLLLSPAPSVGQYAYRAMFPKAESLSTFPMPRVHPPIEPELMKVPYPQPVHRDKSKYPLMNIPPWAVSPPPPINLDRYPPVARAAEPVFQPRFPLVHWLMHPDPPTKHAVSRIPREP